MEEDEVKSAFEIAMERVSGLPELTQEEIAEQKEKEYRPVGEALCYRYLQDLLTAENLPVELNKHRGDSGRIVRQAFIFGLCRSIQMDDSETADKALKGLLELAEDGDGFREEARSLWDRLLNDFKLRVEETFRGLEVIFMESLKSLGITGSAIRPNLMGTELLKKGLADLYQSFEPDLEKFRNMLKLKLQSTY